MTDSVQATQLQKKKKQNNIIEHIKSSGEKGVRIKVGDLSSSVNEMLKTLNEKII